MKAQKKLLTGIIVTMGTPCVSEILSQCGFDWLWIDMEHAPFDLGIVQSMAQASKCPTMVRIPKLSEEWVGRVLDLGVDGIIVPHVNTAEEAKRIVMASWYPPQGNRSLGMSRAGCYGMESKEGANSKRVVWAQIEHRIGVENVREIVKVPGIDGIMIGPYDLSGSMGKPGKIEDPDVKEAIDKVFQVCQKNNMPVGIFAKEPKKAREYIEKGFRIIALGVDVHYLWSSTKAALQELKA